MDPELFMQRWAGVDRCGQNAADAWREFVEKVKASQIAGLELAHFPSGVPYLYLSNSSIGAVSILRLASTTPFVKDLLYKPIWESDPKVREARQQFRDALMKVPGAAYGGGMGRVSVPVRAVAERHEAMLKAVSDLASALGVR